MRSTRTPKHTIPKAESVPIFTKSSNSESGSVAARIATTMPVIIVMRAGTIAGELQGDLISEEAILNAAFGAGRAA